MIRTNIAAVAALGAALTLSACTTPEQDARAEARGQEELAEVLEGRVPGTPVDCIESTFVDGPQMVGDSLIYRKSGKTLYRTVVADSCPTPLRRDQLVIAQIYGTRICRNDQFRLLDRGTSIPSAVCRFGAFVPYEKP